MANVMTSLRLCGTIDWRKYVEAVSIVDHVLRRDPAAVYARMDFLSRDRQRQAVEQLSEPNGEAQVRVALKAIESARQSAAAASASDRAAHVGWHLIGPGRGDLEGDLAYRPRAAERVRRLVRSHATASYLGSIAVVTLGILAGALVYARAAGGSMVVQLVALALLAIPATDAAIALVQRIIARMIPPQRLPRLDLTETAVPSDARTMVIVPTMLTSAAGVEALLEHLELAALGNMDAHIPFALLTDFADAASCEIESDAALLDAARAGIEELNRRYEPENGDRFFLFHRRPP